MRPGWRAVFPSPEDDGFQNPGSMTMEGVPMSRGLKMGMLGLAMLGVVTVPWGCASGQVRSLSLEPSPADGSIAIVDASELTKAYGDGPWTIEIINDGPGEVEVGVFSEAVGSTVEYEKAVEKRTLSAGSEESFPYPGFASLVIVNRSEGEVTVRVVR